MSDNPAWLAEVERRIRNNEGCEPKRYYDSLGIPTIGIGWNLHRDDTAHALATCGVSDVCGVISGKTSLTAEQIDKLFAYAFAPIEAAARDSLAPGVFDSLSDARRFVLCDLQYNLGQRGWLGFPGTRALLNEAQAAKDADDLEKAHALFGIAADHLAASAWDGQVGERAHRDETMIRSGVWV